MPEPFGREEERSPAFIAVSTVFESFGRALVCLDAEFQVIDVSDLLREQLGSDEIRRIIGGSAATLFGDELFGPGGTLRQRLERGERREGLRATLHLGDGSTRPISMNAAPLLRRPVTVYGTTVEYVVIVDLADQGDLNSASGENSGRAIERSPVQLAIGRNDRERDFLRAVLDRHHWRRDEAARALGISRTTLWRRMREAGLI